MALGWFDELKVSLRYMVDDHELDESNNKLRQQEQLLNNVARGAMVIGTASAGALTLVAKANIEFSETMSRVRAILADRTPHEQLAELEDRARRMARELPVGPRETAAAMLEMARAGAAMNDVFAATEPVVKLAILGNMAPADVAKLMVSTAAQFGRPLSQTGEMADMFYSAVINTLLEERDLPSLLRHAGPIAGVMGMGLDEALGFLAGLRQGGLTPEMASTSMRNIVSRLINMTPNQIEGFRDLGIDHEWAQQTAGQGQFIKVLDAMIAADAKIADFERIFQQRALVGAAIYEALGQRMFNPLVRQIRESGDIVDDSMERMLDSLYGAWIRLKSIFQEALLMMGESGIGQFLVLLFKGLRQVLLWFVEAPAPVQWFISMMLLLGTSLLFVGAGLRVFLFLMNFTFFTALLKGAAAVWVVSSGLRIGLIPSLQAAFVWGIRFSSWLMFSLAPALFRSGFGLRFLAAGLWMVVRGGLSALGAVIAFSAGMVLNFVTAVAFGIATLVGWAAAAVAFAAAWIGSLVPALIMGIVHTIAWVHAVLAGALPAALAWAAALLGPVVGALAAVIAKTIAWTVALLANPIVLIILAVMALVGGFVYVIVRWGDAILGFFTGIWDGIWAGAEALFGWLIDGISFIGNLVGKALGWLFGGGRMRVAVSAIEPMARGVSRFAGGGDFGPTAPPIRIEQSTQAPRYEFHNYVDRVDIHAPGGNPDEIGRKFNEMLGEQNKTLVAEFDTGVAG